MNLTTTLILGMSLSATSVLADTMQLYNWGFNVDGAIIDKANTPGPPPQTPPVVFNASGFNFPEGLGAITLTVAGPGPHFVDIFLDHDLLPAQFATDNSAAVGTPAAGESWESGIGSESAGTQLFSAFTGNGYNDTNNATGPADVATGLAFEFVTTPADPLGVITLNVSTTAPASGFYLEQWNTNGSTPSEIYISGSEVNQATPEPATWVLLLASLGCMVVRRRWCSRGEEI